MPAYLHAFGCALPERVVSNLELAGRLGCTPEWIENVCGIQERRWAAREQTIVDLGQAAAEDCLARAGVPAAQIGMLIFASGNARAGFPAPSAELAARLGLNSAPALDIAIASAGGLFGMVLAADLASTYGNILVVASEKMSAVIEAHTLDQNTAILFGDGAGAVLIRAQPGGREILHTALHSDGQFRNDLAYDGVSALKMNGLTVIMQATRKLPSVIKEVLEKAQLTPAAISTFLVHQANQNLLNRVAKGLDVPAERIYSNIARYGNTSSASVLIAAAEWDRENPPPGPVVFAAFGAGLHWGALLAK